MTDRLSEPRAEPADRSGAVEDGRASAPESLADQLGQLLRLLVSSDIEILDVQHAGARFLIRRELSGEPSGAALPAAAVEPAPRSDSFVIASPCVGIFRRTAGGAIETALEPGDVIAPGQVIGAVEAMGMLNRVQSERAGVVQEVLVREGQPIEYGQSLIVVREP